MTLFKTFYKLVCSEQDVQDSPVAKKAQDDVLPAESKALVLQSESCQLRLAAAEVLAAPAFGRECFYRESLNLLLAADSRWVSMGPGRSCSQSVLVHVMFVGMLCLVTLSAHTYTRLPEIHLVDLELTHTATSGAAKPVPHKIDTVTVSKDSLSTNEGNAKKTPASLFDFASSKGAPNEKTSLQHRGKRSHSIHVTKIAPISNRIDDPQNRHPKRVESPERDLYAIGKSEPMIDSVANSTKSRGAFTVSQTTEQIQTSKNNIPGEFQVQSLVALIRSSPVQSKVTSAPEATPTNMTEQNETGSNFVGSQMVEDTNEFSSLIDENGDQRLGLENGWDFGQPDLANSAAPSAEQQGAVGNEAFLRLSWSSSLKSPVFVGGDPQMVARLNGEWKFGWNGYEFGRSVRQVPVYMRAEKGSPPILIDTAYPPSRMLKYRF